jgi:hypothetical protein
MEEPDLFRSMKLSPLNFDQGELYYNVEFKFYPNVKQSLKGAEQEEYELIGRQLVKAFIECRKKNNQNEI